MENNLDQTTLDTISLLEARLRRIEHILYGPTTAPTEPPQESAITSLAELERRFNQLLHRFHKSHPTLFQPPTATDALPPTQLPPDAVRATVLAYASAFPTVASSLTAATADSPIPDARQSAALAALGPRMRGAAALQHAQAREMSELRARSEVAVRAWYEGGVLRYGMVLADVEGRLERVDRGVRRVAKGRVEEEKI
ncbi:hypothetical protein CHGG_06776 [Chaetomium globosum CBS 148.51]|uniref:Nuclear distribution protein RO10 n=1 Tax=Chaetomium globosum (strain ATCC 6205 / CBS 148.51 / DSM 1962 / NBRC 6347 / NRRL 1970) TaxID=306901 RepID=Q2H3I9_CHAGB|nr:uncharacterized protein CHGG_06776 [Chaetomium globosum CBS 148.51]EAQ90157.1 hypothetical protein CHGG_06776 [Chaetomium globosum CBS 148.51]